MANRKSKIVKVRDYQKYYHFYKPGSLFLLREGLYVVIRRRRGYRLILRWVRRWDGTLRTVYLRELVLTLRLKPVFLRGYITGGFIKSMGPKSKTKVLGQIWAGR